MRLYYYSPTQKWRFQAVPTTSSMNMKMEYREVYGSICLSFVDVTLEDPKTAAQHSPMGPADVLAGAGIGYACTKGS